MRTTSDTVAYTTGGRDYALGYSAREISERATEEQLVEVTNAVLREANALLREIAHKEIREWLRILRDANVYGESRDRLRAVVAEEIREIRTRY